MQSSTYPMLSHTASLSSFVAVACSIFALDSKSEIENAACRGYTSPPITTIPRLAISSRSDDKAISLQDGNNQSFFFFGLCYFSFCACTHWLLFTMLSSQPSLSSFPLSLSLSHSRIHSPNLCPTELHQPHMERYFNVIIGICYVQAFKSTRLATDPRGRMVTCVYACTSYV